MRSRPSGPACLHSNPALFSGPLRSPPCWRFRLASLLAAVLAAAIYWPGLAGGFVFDDFSFIVANRDLHVEHWVLGDWVRAAMSFPSAYQGRWLTMLSFAANHIAHGLDPFGYKLVNLAIHLLNGWLVYKVSRGLFTLWAAQRPDQAPPNESRSWVALLVAALWLCLPINLTGVLYVSQRLESLCNLFVLAGLAWYLRERVNLLRGRGSPFRLAAALIIPTLLGLLAKESAILLPLYTACIEIVFLQDARSRPLRRPVVELYAALLLVPLVVGMYWLSTWLGTEHSYARPFTIAERLLTESRVMLHYVQWTLLPQPNDLTLYHDDILLSRGLMSPPSTSLAILGILALLTIAALQRHRRPMLSLGIAWFFGGHLLTGTIIPLELVFEHRNYFPSIGLLLALVPTLYSQFALHRGALIAAALVVLGFYAFSTALRSVEWSDPSRLGLSEARKRPNSPRAQYEFAHNYLTQAGDDKTSPLRREARQALERCRRMPTADTQCDAALILDANRTDQMPDPAWWASLTRKLSARTPNVSDYSAVMVLMQCQIAGRCYYQPMELEAAINTVMSRPNPGPLWVDLAAQFETFLTRRPERALALFAEVVRLEPGNAVTLGNLVRAQIVFGHLDQAERGLDAIRRVNRLGAYDDLIYGLEGDLRQARLAASPTTSSPAPSPTTAPQDAPAP